MPATTAPETNPVINDLQIVEFDQAADSALYFLCATCTCHHDEIID
jgi:hypothetical protein